MALLKTYKISTDIAYPKVIPSLIHKKIQESSFVDAFESVEVDNDNDELHLFGGAILDLPNLDYLVFGLDTLREIRYEEVNAKTRQLIGEGFTFDSQLFSLSVPAQSNWTNLKSNKATFSAMGLFPVQVSTKDNDVYMLSEANIDAFWGAGLTVVKTAYNGGGNIRKLIKDAITKAEIDAIIDNR